MLKAQIQNNLNEAVKQRNEIVRSTLRILLAAILNKEKEKKYKEKIEGQAELTDEEVIEVIASEIKKRKEAILEFGKGKREDLVKKEKAEMEVLKKYLPARQSFPKENLGRPEQLSEEEIKKLVAQAIVKVAAKEVKDMGRVMQGLMPKLKGRADGSQVSQIVKELLAPKESRRRRDSFGVNS